MFDYLLDFFGCSEGLRSCRTIIIDGILQNLSLQNLSWILFTSIFLIFRNSIIFYFKNIFSSEIKPYCGQYYCYRWTKNGEIIKPKVNIRKNLIGKYVFEWKIPNGKISTISKIVDITNREFYITGMDNKKNIHSFYVLHKNYFEPINYIFGTYCFMDMSHRFASGPFLLLT